MKQNQVFTVGQKAFIEKDRKLLVLIDPRHGLDLPGGRLQEGEKDFKISIDREVNEETKLRIKIGSPLSTWIWDKHLEMHKPPVFLVGYRCEYVSGEVELSGEHSHYFWVSKDDYQSVLSKWWDNNNTTASAMKNYFDQNATSI